METAASPQGRCLGPLAGAPLWGCPASTPLHTRWPRLSSAAHAGSLVGHVTPAALPAPRSEGEVMRTHLAPGGPLQHLCPHWPCSLLPVGQLQPCPTRGCTRLSGPDATASGGHS